MVWQWLDGFTKVYFTKIKAMLKKANKEPA